MVILTVFWNMNIIMVTDFLQKKSTVNRKTYCKFGCNDQPKIFSTIML